MSSSVNSNLSNVFENMQQIVEDRANGMRMVDSVVVIDDKLNPMSVGYLCNVTLDGKQFSSAEHALYYLRAMAFRDEHAMRTIASVASATQAKNVKIERFSVNAWRRFEHQSMQTVTGAKLQQHKLVREALRLTGAKRLVYATQHDRYFGCGLSMNDNNILYPQFWLGQNQLGKILEQYRRTI